MKLPRMLLLAAVAALVALNGSVRAETKVELKGVHLCCPGCIKTVGSTLKKVDGVKGACDKENKTVTITATDDKAAQKALDALAAAGFHGETGNKDLAIKEDSGAPAGKVEKLTLTGIHNCCGSCCKAIKEVLKNVEGVKGDTVKPKVTTFEVTGNFDAAAAVKALNDAGYHVKVKK